MERKEKVLYVTDLDGTLLNDMQTVSANTVSVIQKLLQRNIPFCYATARSYITATKVTKGLLKNIPCIIYNGAVIFDPLKNQRLHANYFSAQDILLLSHLLQKQKINPIVYAHVGGTEYFSYLENALNKPTKEFLNTRKPDIRDHPVTNFSKLYQGSIFYLTCIDQPERLFPIYQQLKELYHCIYQEDIYSKEQWLEILPKQATKAQAMLQLKQLLHCEKAVCFGDGKNDLELFYAADECYAVENAVPELKAVATAVIDSNNRDGVATWLATHLLNEL